MFCSQLEKQIPQLFQNNMDIAKSARNQAELHNDAPHRARRRRAYTALKLKSERAFKNLRFKKKNRGNPESCKPDSVVPERTDIHLSARLLNRAPLAGVRHTRDVMDEQPRLLRWGSYPAFSPLPLARRFVFCCTFRTAPLRTTPRLFRRNSALRCPDFPLGAKRQANVRSPSFLNPYLRP